jgi:hypothetical protein
MKAVALFWDRTLVVTAGGHTVSETLAADANAASALLRQLAALPGQPSTVRIIYQPRDLLMQAVETPLGSRAKIRKALSHDNPAIANDLVMWSCQRLAPNGKKGGITLLNMEKASRLGALLSDLALARVQVDGVFPLLTLLERLQAAHNPGRSVVIAHTGNSALLYSRDDAGVRTTAAFYEDAEALALEYFSGTSITPGLSAPAVEIIHTTPEPWPFATYLTEAPGAFPLETFLAEALRIPSSDLSNFAPPSLLPSLNTCAIAAGIIMLAAAAFVAGSHELSVRRLTADLVLKQKHQKELQLELNARQQRHAIIQKAATFTSDLGATPTGLTTLLRTLESTLPREITMTGLRVSDRDFTLEFIAHVASEKTGPYFTFYDALSTKENPWRLTTPKPPSGVVAGNFTLTGVFQ